MQQILPKFCYVRFSVNKPVTYVDFMEKATEGSSNCHNLLLVIAVTVNV